MIEKISVIVPVYNSADTIEKCVLSIMNQTFKNLEIILINDGSKDNSLKICQKLADFDNRIILINQDNKGVSATRNKGLRLATGHYVAFVDSDDWIESEMYENMINAIKDTHSEVCISNYYSGQTKKILNIKDQVLQNNGIYEKIIKNMIGPIPIGTEAIKNKIMGSSWRYLISKSLLERNYITFSEDVYLSEDLIFCIKFLFQTNKLVIDPNAYYHYENIQESATRKYKKNFRFQQQIVFKDIKKICEENGKLNDIEENLNSMYVEMAINEFVNQTHPKNDLSIFRKIKNIKQICDNKLISIVEKTNYKKLKTNRKIIFKLIQHKQYWLIYIFYKLI